MNRREWLLMMGGTTLAACSGPSGLAQSVFGGGWTVAAPLPRPKQEIYPALHNGEIWVTGGFVAENGSIIGPTNETVIYNPDSDSWREGPGIPTPRHHPHLQSHDGKLYAIGGFEAVAADAQWEMQKSGWRLDEDGWNVLPDAPSPIGEAVTASLPTGLHVVGGRTPGGSSNRIWTDQQDVGHHFIWTGKSWQTAAPLPNPRNSATAEVIDGLLHVVGGRTVAGGNSTAHDVYSPDADRWFMRRPMPQGQGGLASGVINGKLYAFGGEYFDNGGGVYPNTWVYDPEADSWEAGPDMLSPRHGLGGVTLNNKIYAVGGALKRGGNETSAAVEILG